MAWIDIPTDENRVTKPSETNPIKPFGSHADTSPAFWQGDILWTVLATSEQTGGVYSLLEQLCAKDAGPAPHWHEQDEAFYVLDGQITFMAGDKTFEASAGAFVFIPRGTVHSFRVDSESARLLNFYLPGAFERVITELGQPAATRTLPPKDLPQDASEAKTNALFAQVGMHTVAVPDFLRNG